MPPRRYYAVRERPGWRGAVDAFFREYVGSFRLIRFPAQRLHSPWYGLRRVSEDAPAPFRDLRLPDGVRLLGTGLSREAGDEYVVLYQLPPEHDFAYLAALQTALERQVLEKSPSGEWTMRGPPERVVWLDYGGSVARLRVRHDPDLQVRLPPHRAAPLLTPPLGRVWLPGLVRGPSRSSNLRPSRARPQRRRMSGALGSRSTGAGLAGKPPGR